MSTTVIIAVIGFAFCASVIFTVGYITGRERTYRAMTLEDDRTAFRLRRREELLAIANEFYERQSGIKESIPGQNPDASGWLERAQDELPLDHQPLFDRVYPGEVRGPVRP